MTKMDVYVWEDFNFQEKWAPVIFRRVSVLFVCFDNVRVMYFSIA